MSHVETVLMITQQVQTDLCFKVYGETRLFKEVSLPISIEVDFCVAPQSENHPDGTAFTTQEGRGDVWS